MKVSFNNVFNVHLELFVAFSWPSSKEVNMVEGGYGEFLLIKHYEYYDKYSGEFVRNMEGITAFHE